MDDHASENDDLIEGFHTNLPVGEILRRARLQRGQSIEYVENVLRIRASHLLAMENGDHDSLPGRVYTIGFVRTYSDYLGLNGEKMVALLKKQALGRGHKPEYQFPLAAEDASVPPQKLVYIGAAAAVLLLIVAIFAFSGVPEEERAVPALSQDLRDEAAKVTAPLADESPQQTAPMTGPETQALAANRIVTVRAEEDSWLQIKNGRGQIVFAQILKEGQELKIPEEPGYVMTAGNAGGILLLVGDRPVPKLGKAGDVRRNVTLDADALEKLISPAAVP